MTQTVLRIPTTGIPGNTSAQGYTLYQYTDVATSTLTSLTFDFRQDPFNWYLDDVSVTTGGGANLLTDGGFEDGLTGWTVGGAIFGGGAVVTGPHAAHSGTHYFVDGSNGAIDQLSQSFATTIGTSYSISFYLANDGGGPALATLTVGGDAPAPVLSPGSDTGTPGDNITSVAAPVLTGTGIAGDTITLFNGATSVGSATVAMDNTWSVTASTLTSGTYSLTTTETDGNNATVATSVPLALTIDIPAAPIGLTLSSGTDSGTLGDGITNFAAPVITGSATPGDTVTLYSGTTVLGSTMAAAGTGSWSITSSMLSDGTYSLTAVDSDSAGDVSAASTALALTIRTSDAAPTGLVLASDSGTPGDGITDVTTPVITGSATAGDTVTLFNNMTSLGSVVVAGDGSWSIISSALTDGTYSLTAVDSDVAGNHSANSTPLAVTILSTATAPTGLALAAGSDRAPPPATASPTSPPP